MVTGSRCAPSGGVHKHTPSRFAPKTMGRKKAARSIIEEKKHFGDGVIDSGVGLRPSH
jgi:hypothetical protein